jgi:hypothetical protein
MWLLPAAGMGLWYWVIVLLCLLLLLLPAEQPASKCVLCEIALFA